MAVYLVEACVIGFNANALQDLLDVLGTRVFIATEGSQQVSSNVTHPETPSLLETLVTMRDVFMDTGK